MPSGPRRKWIEYDIFLIITTTTNIMDYGESYATNSITGCKRKRHRNELWWKHRIEWAMTPGEQVLSQKARDQAYIEVFQLCFISIFWHELLWLEMLLQCFDLLQSYQTQHLPALATILQGCGVMRRTNSVSLTWVFTSALMAHHGIQQHFGDKLQSLVAVKGLMVQIFSQQSECFARLLAADSHLMDLPADLPQGQHALPLRKI
jgi:hypothetical protein